MANSTRCMAKIILMTLDGSGERIETAVKARNMDDLKRRLTGIIDLMSDDDLEPGE